MIVDIFGIEAFLPGSQIDVKPIRDYDQYVEKTITEIVSILTGKVVSYTLEKVSENEYLKLKHLYINTQSKSVQEVDETICFTTFKACF